MEFQNLDEFYTYLRDKLLQKSEEKPTLIWFLKKINEANSVNDNEHRAISITVICGTEVYDNEIYSVKSNSIIEVELKRLDKVLSEEELPIYDAGDDAKMIHALLNKHVSQGGYPHEFLLQTLKFVCGDEE